jgi:hypothetical protein
LPQAIQIITIHTFRVQETPVDDFQGDAETMNADFDGQALAEEDAIRRRLLHVHMIEVIEAHEEAKAQEANKIVVVMADLTDEKGLGTATVLAGQDAIQVALTASSVTGSAAVMVLVGSVGEDAHYPDAWGGPIPEGQIAVQVVAAGGVLNALVEAREVEASGVPR